MKLPSELIDKIFEYYNPWKEIYTEKIINKMNVKNLLEKLDSDYKDIFKYTMFTFGRTGNKVNIIREEVRNSIHRNYNKNKKIKMFEILTHCKCCERHQKNCPNSVYDKWDENPILTAQQTQMSYYKRCSCKCRFYKRLICQT